MKNELFIGSLSWGTTDSTLRDAFANFGEIIKASVIMDRETGRSRGFGFVQFASEQAVTDAIAAMDGQTIDGRQVAVKLAGKKTR